MRDPIERQDAIIQLSHNKNGDDDCDVIVQKDIETIKQLPSAQPDYQEILGWLLAYHTMSFDLHGRYLPHEVISWLINDFTKEFIAERGQNG